MEILMKGAPCATALTEEVAKNVSELKEKNIIPKLAIVRVGEREDDLAYERGALNRMAKCGIEAEVYSYPENITREDFEKAFIEINNDENIHGILVFRPLPENLDEDRIKQLINPIKDVDCMSPSNMAKIFMGDKTGYAPCTAEAVVKLLKYYEGSLSGKNVTILGRSLVVGKPVAELLIAENATVTVCHTKTRNIEKHTQNADIIVAAVGKAHMLTSDMVSSGAVIADVGINVDENGNLCGDADFENVSEKALKISPVPGGVGAVTTSVLAEHTVRAAVMLSGSM